MYWSHGVATLEEATNIHTILDMHDCILGRLHRIKNIPTQIVDSSEVVNHAGVMLFVMDNHNDHDGIQLELA